MIKMHYFRKSQILIFILFLFLSGCDLKEKVADGIDAAFIEVSGNVSHNGIDVSGAIVILVKNVDITDGFAISNGSITGNNGNYNIYEVEPGDYFIAAIDDNNDNLIFDIETDKIGFHGVNPSELDFDADKITVNEEDVGNIDIIYMVSL